MNKLLRNKKLLLGSFFPIISFDSSDFEKYKKSRGLFIEDPWERVKSVFSKELTAISVLFIYGAYYSSEVSGLENEYESLHPELSYALHAAEVGGVGGALFGSILGAMKQFDKFTRTNDTNIYFNLKEAYKALNNEYLKGVFFGACKWAPRIAFFCGSFSLISSCCELYRNKPKIIDNTIAGFSVGALCRLSLGVRGMIGGAIIGGMLGTFYGVIIWSLYTLTNTDHMEVKFAQFAFKKHREHMNNLATTPKDELHENLEKSGLYIPHIPDPLDALDNEDHPANAFKKNTF